MDIRSRSYPKICIIILNWNGLEDTVECLESLQKITYPNYEVIVVDNGSEGNDAEVLSEKFGDYIIKNNKDYSFAEGCNIGMRHAFQSLDPDYILLLNNDTVADPEFLTELVKVAESSPEIGIVGPKIYRYSDPNKFWMAGDTTINWWTGKIRRLGDTEEDTGQYDRPRYMNQVNGAALFAKRGALERLSLLDSSFFFTYEDVDLCFRAHKEGIKTAYAPSSKVWHKSHHTGGKVLRTSTKVEILLRY